VKKIRYAVVGIGSIAQEAVLPAFQHGANSELAALVSGDEEKREELGRRYHCRTYGYEQYDEGLSKAEDRLIPKRDQFAPELIYFSTCILDNREPEPAGEEGLIDVQIIRAAYGLSFSRSGKSRSGPGESCRPPSRTCAADPLPARGRASVAARQIAVRIFEEMKR